MKAKTQEGYPYAQTPARLATSLANLKKGEGVAREKVYRSTERRLIANRSNLVRARAAHGQELEKLIDRLDLAFPPPAEYKMGTSSGDGIEAITIFPIAELAGEPLAECVTVDRGAALESQDPKAASQGSATVEPGIEDPESEAQSPPVPRPVWVFGWPLGRDGVNRGAPEFKALELVAFGIVRRPRTILWKASLEGRRVMRLLTEAAARTADPTLNDILGLARGLMTVLHDSPVLGHLWRVNRRVEARIEKFLDDRYGQTTGQIFSLKAQLLRPQALPQKGAGLDRAIDEQPPQRLRRWGRRRRRARPAPESEQENVAYTPARLNPPQPEQLPATGPDLPATFEEFRLLFRHAFLAPGPEPEKGRLRVMLDALARSLWQRLHFFEQKMQERTEQLDQALDEMARAVPDNTHELVRRQLRIGNCLRVSDAEEILATFAQRYRRHLAIVIGQRYRLDPERLLE